MSLQFDEKRPILPQTSPTIVVLEQSSSSSGWERRERARKHSFCRILLTLICAFVALKALPLLFFALYPYDHHHNHQPGHFHHHTWWSGSREGSEGAKGLGNPATDSDICFQHPALAPAPDPALDAAKETIYSDEYKKASVGLWSGAVQVKSESFDDNGAVEDDERWLAFYNFADYLEKSFPLVHQNLRRERVNTHGLLFTWTGTDPTLKPALLMAHQDTVPVNLATLDQWTYPPWSGHYDGTYLWGRGASDCKSLLIGELEAVTLLLDKGFRPRRTLLLAFGFDEESKGIEGAGHLGPFITDRFGPDGLELILDEGGMGVHPDQYGVTIAQPGTGEKGYVDVNITLSTHGGHSSVPPPHTGIGIISEIVTILEGYSYEPELITTNPFFGLLQCAAEHGTDIDPVFRKKIKQSITSPTARREVASLVASKNRGEGFLFTTSQAVDIIGGGVKVNALPELSYVVVNYRIRPGSTPLEVQDTITTLLAPVAKKYNLDLNAFGTEISHKGRGDSNGYLKFDGINELDPAPVSPTQDPENTAWKALSGTIQTVFGGGDQKVIVAPGIMTGNTDTRFHWKNTKNIYRFSPIRTNGSFNAHTVDEHHALDAHLDTVYFIHSLVRNLNTDL